ncbi:MAG: response regulator transcription factor [Rhodobacteraceae bacterium]|nr:response regulator transcription factor [Paracoccaceae bacterium]
MRIVLVEDNESLAKGISYRMEDLGHAVDLVSDGLQADNHLRTDGGDLVILDINLPGLDGLSLLRRMRGRGDQRPVILLTARSDTEERVRGLDSGADDYMVKPFEMAELEARVRALARRQSRDIRDQLVLGPLTLDLGAREVELGGAPDEMPRREVSILELLLAAEGRTVPKADLLDHTYGIGADVDESVIEVHISRLRKRLKPHGLAIRVRRGIGYSISLEQGT